LLKADIDPNTRKLRRKTISEPPGWPSRYILGYKSG